MRRSVSKLLARRPEDRARPPAPRRVPRQPRRGRSASRPAPGRCLADQRGELFGEQCLGLLAGQGPSARTARRSGRGRRRRAVRARPRPIVPARRCPVHLADAVAEPVQVQARPGATEAVGRQAAPRRGVGRVAARPRRGSRVPALRVRRPRGRCPGAACPCRRRAGLDGPYAARPEPVHWPSSSRYRLILSAGHSASSSATTRSSTSLGVPSASVQVDRSQPAR